MYSVLQPLRNNKFKLFMFYFEHPHSTDYRGLGMNNKYRKGMGLVAGLVWHSRDTQGLGLWGWVPGDQAEAGRGVVAEFEV